MTAYAGLAILHASVAAALIEALLRVWRVRGPAERLRLRWLALLAPLTLTPAFVLLAPFRTDPSFSLRWGLFSGARWDVFSLAGVPMSRAVTLVLAAGGVVLFVRDVGTWLAGRIRIDPEQPSAPGYQEHAARFARVAARAARRIGMPLPRLRLVARRAPVLLCTGVERPAIEASGLALDLLDDDALEAALAHELVHVRLRDPAHGWVLIAVRTLQAVNPVAHVMARLIVQDIEARADAEVAGAGLADGLARAIARLSTAGAEGVSDLAPEPAWRAVLTQAQDRAVADRCERVVAQVVVARPSRGVLRLVLASAGVASVLFLVT